MIFRGEWRPPLLSGVTPGLRAAVVVTPLLLALGCSDSSGQNGAAGSRLGAETSEDASAGSLDTALALLAEELLPEIEQRSGLEVLRMPALARSSRDQMERYLVDALAEQLPPERAQAIVAAYARFGLLPDTLQLGALLRSLLLEQVVGYYDPRQKTLFVVEGVTEEQLEPVLVHELVHALQDQHVDLDSLRSVLEDENDRATAAQAAIEGHATYVMLEWLLARQAGGSVDLRELPDLGMLLGGADLTQIAGTPVLGNAPRVLRESLIFPYVGGLIFLQSAWQETESKPLPFGGDLPTSTEQLLHPRGFFNERDEPTHIGFPDRPPVGWTEVHGDALGELETRIFLEEHLGTGTMAEAAAEGWDGDRYRLLRGPEGEVLVWASVWDTEADAVAFADASGQAFSRRYGAEGEAPPGDPRGPRVYRGDGRAVRVAAGQQSGSWIVTVVDAPADFAVDDAWTRLELESRSD